MSDIAFKVIAGNGYDDIIFKTIMIKGNTGTSIDRIEKTSTSGNVDTYTVYLTDGSTAGTFTVTNSDASSLSNLTDVDLTSASDGQALVYDATSGKWKNATISMPAESSQGNIASFNTNVAGSLYECIAQITAQQAGSGTPSPTNVREISGFTGANIVVNGKNFIDVSIGNLESGTINGTTGATEASNTRVRNTTYYPFPFDYLYEQGYKLTIPNGYKLAMRFYDKNGAYIQGVGWIIGFITELSDYFHNKGVCYAKFIFAKTDDSNITPSDIASIHYQLEFGNQSTTYTPYNSTTTTISWQTEAGTIYGGVLDIMNGMLTVTHGYIDLGSLSWDYTAQGYGRSSTAITNPKLPASESTTANIICECLIANSANQVYSHNEGIAVDSASRVRVYWSTMPTTSSDIKTALNGQLLVYELANPVTYDLNNKNDIKTLFGNNNIYADTGEIALKFNQIKFAS